MPIDSVFRSRRSGFTLLELLVVISIVALCAALVMPRWSGMGQSVKANQAAAVVSSDLQRAFSEASKNRRPVRIAIDVANRRYTLSDRQSGQVILERFMTGATVDYALTGLTAAPATIDIFPNGIASSSLVVTVRVRSQQRQINMTRLGGVRVS